MFNLDWSELFAAVVLVIVIVLMAISIFISLLPDDDDRHGV